MFHNLYTYTDGIVRGRSGWSCTSCGFTLFFILYGAVTSVVNTAQASPRTPVDGEEVLETLPFSVNNESAQLKELRKQLKLHPTYISLASQLATAYIQTARVNSDSRYYGYAKAVLKPWWEKQRPPQEVLFLRATLQQHQHKYTQATSDLKQLLKQQPRHTQAWLTLSIIQQLQGEYPAARASCSALARTSSTASVWLSSLCHSQILSLTGSAERAHKLQQVLALQVNSNQHELRQWVLGLSAETASRLGNAEQAEKYFKQALALPLRDAYLLRNYSDYLIAEGRSQEVLKLLKDETKDDALLLRLAIAAKYASESRLMEKYKRLLESCYKAASLRGSKLHERDEALYLLEFGGDEKRALKLALANWEIQREPDDALILLRASVANQFDSGIQTIRDWLSQTKLQDVRLENLLGLYKQDQQKGSA